MQMAGDAVVVASANGLPACARAYDGLRRGEDVLEAIVAGVGLVEDDPAEHSVGLGGLPNADGVVELDASVMHGPTHRAGAVAALRNVRNAARLALRVMQRLDHVLIVGEGALRFAIAEGFPQEDLLTPEAQSIWLRWREARRAAPHSAWHYPEADREAQRALHEGPDFTYGTINCLGRSPAGDLAGCTSTSGLSYKHPGRVGDSPILGAGLYVDNEVGAAGSTGRGEANLLNCSSFLVVERMRAGLPPQEACLEALARVAQRTEPRLRDAAGRPRYSLSLYALRKDGVFGGASLHPPGRMAVADAAGTRCVEIPAAYG